MNNAIGVCAGESGKSVKKTLFRRNVGGIDRAVRLGVGIVLVSGGLFQMIRGHGGGLAVILGLVILTMATAGICPLYIPFRISTARTKRKKTANEGGATRDVRCGSGAS